MSKWPSKKVLVEGGLMTNTLNSRSCTLGLSTGHSHSTVLYLGKTLDLKMPLSAHEQFRVRATCQNAEGNLQWTSIPFRDGTDMQQYSQCCHATETGIAQLMWDTLVVTFIIIYLVKSWGTFSLKSGNPADSHESFPGGNLLASHSGVVHVAINTPSDVMLRKLGQLR